MVIRGFAREERPRHPLAVDFDDSQRAVLALDPAESAAVLGAPGTGKTSTLVELAAHRVHSGALQADELVVLAATRTAATRLRDRLAVRIDRATSGPLARTAGSFAFDVLRRAAVRVGAEPPALLTGGEHDLLIRQLLEGHLEEGTGPEWPEQLGPEVRALTVFRTELRELLMRATEHGVDAERLDSLGRALDRPEWVAAARFLTEYTAVVAASGENRFDPAELVAFAAAAIERGETDDAFDRLRLVLVDDLQEATESTLALLRAIAARGVPVVAFGDPDVATNAFRGGEPDALGRLSSALGVPVRTLHLSTAHRQGPALRALTSAVAARIGTAAAGGQRRAVAGAADGPEPVRVALATTPARQYAAIARELREQHLLAGVAWERMAVVVRSGALIPAITRALAHAEVPTRATSAARALRDEPAARALLTLVDVGLGRSPLTPESATALLLSPFGGMDRLALRTLRLALRTEELAGGGDRPADALLVEALGAPGRFATIDHRVGRAGERLAATLTAIGESASAGATIEELLWLAWSRSGLAGPWSERALGAGIEATEANRDLDAVVALFTAATRFVERQPDRAPTAFLDDLLDAEVPEDTLSPQTRGSAVVITTPSGLVGREFEVVAVAGVQEGVWPNQRLRGSLLGAGQLVRVAAGLDTAAIDERQQVLSDELRMFALAVSRARSRVLLTAVQNDDEAASVFLSLIPDGGARLESAGVAPFTLRSLVGRLRRELTAGDPSPARREAAAAALARLAADAVPGADPGDWHGLREPSTSAPLWDLDDPETRVPVSPSQLEHVEQSPLNWFVDRVAGSETSPVMGVGTVLHWAMETAESADVESLWRAVESRWGELPFESEWVSEHQRRVARRLTEALAAYLGDFDAAGKQLVSAEGRFELDLGRARLRGAIDRVERARDGTVVIVDLKTGTPVTRQAEIDAHAQLTAYQLAYSAGLLELEEGHAPGGAKLLFVKSGKGGKPYREAVQLPLDEERIAVFRERVAECAVRMAAASFEGSLDVDDFTPAAKPRYRLHVVKAVSSD